MLNACQEPPKNQVTRSIWPQFFAIVPIEQISNAKFSVTGYGYEVGEMPVEPSAVKQFEKFKFPCALELTMDAVLYKGKITQIVTGTTTPIPVKSVSNG